jgi:hypothetical protein
MLLVSIECAPPGIYFRQTSIFFLWSWTEQARNYFMFRSDCPSETPDYCLCWRSERCSAELWRALQSFREMALPDSLAAHDMQLIFSDSLTLTANNFKIFYFDTWTWTSLNLSPENGATN